MLEKAFSWSASSSTEPKLYYVTRASRLKKAELERLKRLRAISQLALQMEGKK
jgi:hypothetical protein